MEDIVLLSCEKQNIPYRKFSFNGFSNDLWAAVQDGSVADGDSSLAFHRNNGGNINFRNSLGLTPLHIAIWRNHIPIVKRLLAAGADPNATDEESGWSSLHRSLNFGHLIVASILLQYGASITLEDTKSRTPIDLLSGPDLPGIEKNSSKVISGLGARRVKAVAAAKHHTVIATEAREVFTWGSNREGQLRFTSIDTQPTPHRVSSLRSKVVALAVANKYTAVVSDLGEVFTWGCNKEVQLGYVTSNLASNYAPRVVEYLKGKAFVGVAAAKYHTIVLGSDGKVFTWGHRLVTPKRVVIGRILKKMGSIPLKFHCKKSLHVVAIAAGATHKEVLLVSEKDNVKNKTAQPLKSLYETANAEHLLEPRNAIQLLEISNTLGTEDLRKHCEAPKLWVPLVLSGGHQRQAPSNLKHMGLLYGVLKSALPCTMASNNFNATFDRINDHCDSFIVQAENCIQTIEELFQMPSALNPILGKEMKSPLSVSGSLSIYKSIVSLPLDDDAHFVSVDALVDPIDDRIDSSCKINLSPPSVEANVMNESTPSIDSLPIVDDLHIVRVDTLVDPIDDQIESSCKIDLCPPSVEAIVLNERTSFCETCVDQRVCENCPPLEVLCVVINRTQVSEEFDNVGQQNGSESKSYSQNNLVLEIALKLDIDLSESEELTCDPCYDTPPLFDNYENELLASCKDLSNNPFDFCGGMCILEGSSIRGENVHCLEITSSSTMFDLIVESTYDDDVETSGLDSRSNPFQEGEDDTSQMAALAFYDFFRGQHLTAQDLVTPRAKEYTRKDHFEQDIKQSCVWKVAWMLALILTEDHKP
ncbi:C2 domain-containing family protein [Capsicum annuum]|nr:C2 domain-containing family protein [Capsicum annuum]